MIKKNTEENPVLVINTALQKKNDKNIQNFLNKYKHYDENPEYLKNTKEHVNLIISHKSTIPDLVIYNQVFNKNLCFIEANKNENNYFPRHNYYIKFEGDEKLISRGVKNSKNEVIINKENKENKENKNDKKEIQVEGESQDDNNFDDDDEEEEDEDDSDNNIDKIKNENQSKINNVSNVEVNSIISNNNSMYKEIENLPNNTIDKINLLSTDSTLNPKVNLFDTSINSEEGLNNITYSSRVMNNINSYIRNDDNSFSDQTNYQNNNFQNYQNFPNNNFNNNNIYNIAINNMNNNNNNNNNNNQGFINNGNNKIVNMFSQQYELLELIKQKKNNNPNGVNDEIINKLQEDVNKLVLFGPDGNIINKIMNFEEMLIYLTNNILVKNKDLDKYDIYIIETEEKIKVKEFYYPIINFCDDFMNQ